MWPREPQRFPCDEFPSDVSAVMSKHSKTALRHHPPTTTESKTP